MTKSSRNSVLAFVWAVVALLALYVLPASLDARASVCDCSSYESFFFANGGEISLVSKVKLWYTTLWTTTLCTFWYTALCTSEK